jgi:hypothetical protein
MIEEWPQKGAKGAKKLRTPVLPFLCLLRLFAAISHSHLIERRPEFSGQNDE